MAEAFTAEPTNRKHSGTDYPGRSRVGKYRCFDAHIVSAAPYTAATSSLEGFRMGGAELSLAARLQYRLDTPPCLWKTFSPTVTPGMLVAARFRIQVPHGISW